jgi:hypothetical protein
LRLTLGVCAVGDLRSQNYLIAPNFEQSYTAALRIKPQ